MTTDPLVCEFCNGQPPQWSCPARDVSTTVTTGQDSAAMLAHEGPWLACGECCVLIVGGKREELVERAMATVLGMDVSLPPGSNRGRINDTVRAAVRKLHDDFWRSREGAPVRLDTTNEGSSEQHG